MTKITANSLFLYLNISANKTAKVEVVWPEGNDIGSSSTISKLTLSKLTNGLGSKITYFKTNAIPSAINNDNKHIKAIYLIFFFLKIVERIITKIQRKKSEIKPPRCVINGIILSNKGFWRL